MTVAELSSQLYDIYVVLEDKLIAEGIIPEEDDDLGSALERAYYHLDYVLDFLHDQERDKR